MKADNFYCEICDFKSKWENGLNIHMSTKHSNLEQLDGNLSVSEDSNEYEQYSSTKHYWEKGFLGTSYQAFLDANKVIDKCDISEEGKVIENGRVFEARNQAFGSSFEYFPPWNSR